VSITQLTETYIIICRSYGSNFRHRSYSRCKRWIL